jgi:hypothetical protein
MQRFGICRLKQIDHRTEVHLKKREPDELMAEERRINTSI